jgi:hypothetical protein
MSIRAAFPEGTSRKTSSDGLLQLRDRRPRSLRERDSAPQRRRIDHGADDKNGNNKEPRVHTAAILSGRLVRRAKLDLPRVRL